MQIEGLLYISPTSHEEGCWGFLNLVKKIKTHLTLFVVHDAIV